jgi:hypothetical protein
MLIRIIYCFLVWAFLHAVWGKFTDDVSETAVVSIFTGHELESKSAKEWGTALYRGRVSVGLSLLCAAAPKKFTWHTLQKSQNQYSFHRMIYVSSCLNMFEVINNLQKFK